MLIAILCARFINNIFCVLTKMLLLERLLPDIVAIKIKVNMCRSALDPINIFVQTPQTVSFDSVS